MARARARARALWRRMCLLGDVAMVALLLLDLLAELVMASRLTLLRALPVARSLLLLVDEAEVVDSDATEPCLKVACLVSLQSTSTILVEFRSANPFVSPTAKFTPAPSPYGPIAPPSKVDTHQQAHDMQTSMQTSMPMYKQVPSNPYNVLRTLDQNQPQDQKDDDDGEEAEEQQQQRGAKLN